jgi:hypothetical protein
MSSQKITGQVVDAMRGKITLVEEKPNISPEAKVIHDREV